MQESKKFVAFVGELLNVGSKIIHKKGVFAVFSLSDEAVALGSLNVEALKKEWPGGALEANAKVLGDELKAKLDLENKEVEAKIKLAVDVIVEAVGEAGKVVSIVNKAKAVFA